MSSDNEGARAPRIYAAVLGLISLPLLAGGGRLLTLGGSPYYLLAGLAMMGSAVLLWRGRRAGVWLYWSLFVATVAWAIFETGLDGWGLMPRLVAFMVVGAWMLLPGFQRRLAPLKLRAPGCVAFAVGVVAAVALGAGLHRLNPGPADPLFQTGVGPYPQEARLAPPADPTPGEWPHWGRQQGGARFSPLDQINPSNVGKLQVAWRAPLWINDDARVERMEGVPLMIGDALYACNGMNEVFALDAETGARRWTATTPSKKGGRVCRGLAYYRVPGATGPCAERLITATGLAALVALDLHTGARCQGFGPGSGKDAGVVNLLEGMGAMPNDAYYRVSSAPAVVRGKVVLGGWVMDGQFWGEPSGVIRAFDAVTGKLAWAWDMGRPDRTGAPAPGESYTHSTPNSWAPMSADEELGLVYAPVGNSPPDYFGAQRRPFDDKYSSSVVALDADTGRPRWSFQTAHHDLWDYDVASQPTLVDLPDGKGGVVKALVQGTKRGEVFVLDRTTGQPIRSVVERPVPQRGAVPEERLSKTQPFSVGVPSFRSADVTEAQMWGITPLDQLWCRIRFRQARYEGPLTPPGLDWSLAAPGYLGGQDWGSVSVDPRSGVMVLVSNKIANYNRLLTRAEADAKGLKPWGLGGNSFAGGPVAQGNTPYGAHIHPFLSPLEVPCQAPPYGRLSAVDLVTGKLIWTHPVGSARNLGPMGVKSQLPLTLGTPTSGGTMLTASGLVFVGATQDRGFRAFDTRTGKRLWETVLSGSAVSTPVTYRAPRSGRQMVVISTGAGAIGGPRDATLVAFALPK